MFRSFEFFGFFFVFVVFLRVQCYDETEFGVFTFCFFLFSLFVGFVPILEILGRRLLSAYSEGQYKIIKENHKNVSVVHCHN